jgi:hypothetical protein
LFETFIESQIRLSVVEWLSTREGPVDLEELSRTVTDEHELPRDIVEMRLHHVHLPKLARLGLFTYDAPEQTVDGYSTDQLDDVVESFIASFPAAERTFERTERVSERGEQTADGGADYAAAASMDDAGHVEVPPPHGSDEDD